MIGRIAFTAVCLAPAMSHAGNGPHQHKLVFDLPNVCSARTVASEETSSEVKLIDTQVELSVLSDSHVQIDHLRVEIRNMSKSMRVIDLKPKTVLDTRYTEDIQISKVDDREEVKGLSLGGTIRLPGGSHGIGTPSWDWSKSKRDGITESSTQRSPKHLVVASGTLHRGHGAFYKLNRTDQTTLEGQHVFHLRFSVPASWRGDWLLLRIEAQTTDVRAVPSFSKTHGMELAVGVHQQGNDEARQAALQLANAQSATLTPPARHHSPLPCLDRAIDVVQDLKQVAASTVIQHKNKQTDQEVRLAKQRMASFAR